MTDRKRAAEKVDAARAITQAKWERTHEYSPGDHVYGHYRPVAIDLQCALDEAVELLKRASGKINSERYEAFQSEIADFLSRQRED